MAIAANNNINDYFSATFGQVDRDWKPCMKAVFQKIVDIRFPLKVGLLNFFAGFSFCIIRSTVVTISGSLPSSLDFLILIPTFLRRSTHGNILHPYNRSAIHIHNLID